MQKLIAERKIEENIECRHYSGRIQSWKSLKNRRAKQHTAYVCAASTKGNPNCCQSYDIFCMLVIIESVITNKDFCMICDICQDQCLFGSQLFYHYLPGDLPGAAAPVTRCGCTCTEVQS